MDEVVVATGDEEEDDLHEPKLSHERIVQRYPALHLTLNVIVLGMKIGDIVSQIETASQK